MAKVITSSGDEHKHLQGIEHDTLCGRGGERDVHEGGMTCPECAAVALRAMELVTRAEKREWRQLMKKG